MVFDIPPRGTAVKLQETLTSHKTAICELEAQGGRMVSSDEEGNIILWQSGGHFTEIIKIDGKGLAVTSFFLSEVNFTFLQCCWCTIQQKKLKWKMFFCQVKYNKFLKIYFFFQVSLFNTVLVQGLYYWWFCHRSHKSLQCVIWCTLYWGLCSCSLDQCNGYFCRSRAGKEIFSSA